jgi:HNH endonuclease
MNLADRVKEIFNCSFIPTPGCWIWKGSKTSEGYGRIKICQKELVAHRVSYAIYKGKIPKGLVIRHKCDNPNCVNPEHLLTGTHGDNMQDKVERNRQARGAANGKSKLNETQVREIRTLRDLGWTLQKIGDTYGVTKQSVRDIIIGKHWSHLE